MNFPILSTLIFLPLIAAAWLFMLRGEEGAVARNAKWIGLWFTLANFILSLGLWAHFSPLQPGFQFVEKTVWLENIGASYHVGVDGISLFFIILSTFLTLLCVIASWEQVKSRVREYFIAFLLLETMMVGMFAALDMWLFYVFFEGVLIPMFLIIGMWGGPRRVYAAFKFFLYTLLGSVLMLLAMIAMYKTTGTTDIPTLLTSQFTPQLQFWLWLAFFASFAVKVPMWPVHTWLPDAHVEAPTAGSVILAGVLLKMGAYGFLRFSLPMFPDASLFFAPLVFTLSLIAVVYTSLVALAQQDMKKLIAYSSVAHMGFVTLGLFTFTQQGMEGAVIQMISHGFISAALFLCVGVLYDRIHSRDIAAYGGLVNRMPVYALVFMLFMLGSVGLPGTSGFVGESLVLIGAYQVKFWLSAIAATGVILGAAYMLWLYARVVFGTLEKPSLQKIKDLHWREKLVFAPLVVAMLWMGIYPSSFSNIIAPPIAAIYQQLQLAQNETIQLSSLLPSLPLF
ncbi:MAG: NADH-quinone oxidoreductase subunit M [Dongiaceae bacterium]